MESSFLIISLTAFAACVALWAVCRGAGQWGGRFTLRSAVLLGTFLALLGLHFPMYYEAYSGQPDAVLKGILVSLHNTMRVFIMDGEVDPLVSFASNAGEAAEAYRLAAVALYVLGPVLTFSFVLTFIKNISGAGRMALRFFSETYIFSALNESSAALAGSIRRGHRRALIVFAGVEEQERETELEQQVRGLGAVIFQREAAALRLGLHMLTNRVTFIVMGEDTDQNTAQGLAVFERWGSKPGTRLFVFSDSTQSELLFQTAREGGMVVRRVDMKRSIVNSMLYESGREIFDSAREDGGGRYIGAVILGLEGCGTEAFKALCWYGQMTGYELHIDVFDRSEDAQDRLSALCPELMEMNGVRISGEAEYFITVHSGVGADTGRFAGEFTALKYVTWVFADLNNDSETLSAAVRARELSAGMGMDPVVRAVVRSSRMARSLKNAVNFKNQPYNIVFTGDMDSACREETVMSSALEQEALARHKKWGTERDFWEFEYNFRSSVASALHVRLRRELGIPGAEKPAGERTHEEREALRIVEHRRWNAFMRTEGYRWSGSRDRSSRNDLAKLHHDLVPYDELSEEEKAKDDI